MKIFLSIVVLLAVLLIQAAPVMADEARYNFASAQGDKQIRVTPGGESKGVIYFYNIDGNRITHVSLQASGMPADWQVEIQPPQHEIEVVVNDLPVKVSENLNVEPSSVSAEEPVTVPEGMVSISVPSRGYALACPAYIVVKAPASAQIGSTTDITINAVAEWLGQSGAAAMKQARDFTFSVAVVSASNQYTEKIVEPGEAPATPAKTVPTITPPAQSESPGSSLNTEKNIGQGETQAAPSGTPPAKTTAAESASPGFSLMSWMPAIAAAVVVILGVIVVTLLVRRRR